MRSSMRRTKRRERSKAVAVLGNVLLMIATLAVVGLVAYLVVNPPGADSAAGAGLPLATAPGSSVPAGTGTAVPPPTTASVVPPPSSGGGPPATPTAVPTGQLGLSTACSAINPLLNRADDVRNQAIEDTAGLDPATVSALTSELNTVAEISPPLTESIDQLNQVLVDLNNELLAGADFPDVDNESAEAATTQLRALCAG